MAISIGPEDRDEIVEVVKEYVDDLFEAFSDGKITQDELRTSTTELLAGLAGLVIPDEVEAGVLPFLQAVLGTVWTKFDGLFRSEDRLEKRIAEAVAAGKTTKAARLQEILDRIDGE